ncbi:NUDIX hydrolase [Urechidicola vernalis]|uniref:NUDIX domain-containing protein n=1 Tax=Urechidicola vernalis TaxID=3075600 RepID=A0ABU2Y3V6_9FLAO|nr:NUDIX domain-containing protein [Urechidicola sp. P050]MDT0551935.1 NUDIX domain-containing protein [Urechidicola sp. P050]
MNQKEVTIAKPVMLDKNFFSGHSVDCVILGFEQGEIKVLLLKWKAFEKWSLPGGFIGNDEDLDKAAIRILQERTGISLPFLEQFHSFGDVNRKGKESFLSEIKSLIGHDSNLINWISQRFISTGYLSLVNIKKCNLVPDELSERCEWVSLNNVSNLIYDHNEMIKMALQKIKMQLNYLPIGITLLDSKFTMKELQLLYQSILGKEIDRGNFQKKMLKLDILIRLEKQNLGGAHKAPYLYKFDKLKYKKLLKKGFGYIN